MAFSPSWVGARPTPPGWRGRFAGRELAEGDWLCLDGNAGRVPTGRQELAASRPTEWLQRVEGWKEHPSNVIPAAADEFA